MKAWWGRLSLRMRLAGAFSGMALGALVFLVAIVARTIGWAPLHEGKIIPAAVAVLVMLVIGSWLVAGWCLEEIAEIGAGISEKVGRPLPAELEGLAALLRREAQKHDRLLRELRRFTADAAHELRTPLTALRTIGEVSLRRPLDNAAAREAIVSMLEEARLMNNLIEQMLRLARLESDEWPVRIRHVNVRAHVQTACDSLLALAEEKQVRVEVACEDGLKVSADTTLLMQALMNVLDNAIRHAPEGSAVTVRAAGVAGVVVIEVRDEGPGIGPEHHERIFERFYRVEASRGRGSGGAGLGLCIAQTAVQRMQGRITVASQPGQGATFRIELPAA